jgi:hypothetical protein
MARSWLNPTWTDPIGVKASTVANQLALVKACEDHPEIKKIFSYHSSVSAASCFVAPGPEGVGTHIKDFYTGTINSVGMDTDQRRDTFRLFEESPKGLISNYRCLIHGVNAPSVNLVMFASPKRSRIDCVQAAGRALRKAPGKSCGYILLCTYVATPENESIEEAARRTKFDTLLDVLQALKEWDEKFVDILRELAQPKARAKGYADWVLRDRVQLIGPPVLLEALEKSIRVQVIDRLIPRWEKSFAEVVAFVEQNGRWPRASRWIRANGEINLDSATEEEMRLGQWCSAQRRLREEGALSQQRSEGLEAIGIVWDPRAVLWQETLANLDAYLAEHGDIEVPKKHPLHTLIGSLHNRRRKGQLSPEQMAELKRRYNFCWDKMAQERQRFIEELIQFKAKEGHLNVPLKTPLGRKVGSLRSRRKQGKKVNWDLVAQVDAIGGFCWDILDAQFAAFVEQCRQLLAQHGEGGLTAKIAGKSFAARCKNYRIAYKRGELTESQMAQLNAINFPLDRSNGRRDDGFKAKLEILKQFYAEHHCRPSDTRNTRPGKCVEKLRRLHRKGALTPEQIAQVNAIDPWILADRAAITHCQKGHPFDEANTIWRKENGQMKRSCRQCKNAWRREYRAEKALTGRFIGA